MKKVVDKKPWGYEDIFALNKKASVKILHVAPGKKFSLQKHKYRREVWVILEGPCRIWLGRRKIRAKKDDEFVIKPGQLHRVEGLSKEAKVLEISSGKFDRKDIVRVEDDFGRA